MLTIMARLAGGTMHAYPEDSRTVPAPSKKSQSLARLYARETPPARLPAASRHRWALTADTTAPVRPAGGCGAG